MVMAPIKQPKSDLSDFGCEERIVRVVRLQSISKYTTLIVKKRSDKATNAFTQPQRDLQRSMSWERCRERIWR